MGKQLLELLFTMPGYGAGARMTRKTLERLPQTFWTVTRVEPSTKALVSQAAGLDGGARRRVSLCCRPARGHHTLVAITHTHTIM